MALLAAAPLALSLSAGAQTLAVDLGYRLPDEFGTPEADPLALSDTLDGPPHDPWLGRDKAYHVGVSFGLALGAHVALTEGAGMEPKLAAPLAGGLAFGVGLAKEVMDSRRAYRPLFSWRDLAADAAGVALAIAVSRL
ncbi:hypothetical protein [Rubricoccus marinus]|uniref:DUF2279 domain-containing protein n=1 Tax=Rubricoccus marinus TaxID=716817 RepID=A0A259TYK1_9BACT|nr:hypothetical protein [Rubricoccus marinus]OZC02697.1 hypothetical protein BSZ36_06740 [Rubricoccus marinus]